MTDRATASHGRMHALDGLRATMMLLGLVLHTTVSYTTVSIGAAWPYDDPATTLFADLLTLFIHVFRMPIFFVLAGFFAAMLYLRRGEAGLVRNRLERIAAPFVVALMVLTPLVISGFTFANVAKAQGTDAAWAAVTAIARTPALYVPTNTLHLWFIYYLMYFYVGAIFLVRASAWIPPHVRAALTRAFRTLVSQPIARIALPAAVTFCTLLSMGGVLATKNSFVPDFAVLLAYAVFFAFGWLLYGAHDVLQGLTKGAWFQVVTATAGYFAYEILLLPGLDPLAGTTNALTSGVNSIVTWTLFYGFTGLFLKYLDKPSATIRYAVDASYWVYLVHLPCTIWIAGLLVNTDLSVWSRMLIGLTGTTIIGAGTYALFVRSTVIGRVLNGSPRTAAAMVPSAAS